MSRCAGALIADGADRRSGLSGVGGPSGSGGVGGRGSNHPVESQHACPHPSLHNLTTQLPGEISFALPQGRRAPALHDFRTRVFFMAQGYYAYGIEERNLDGVLVKVYSPAKTVADCFKCRNKTGIDVAIESLRECLVRKAATIDEIVRAARAVRAEKVILPNFEGVTA